MRYRDVNKLGNSTTRSLLACTADNEHFHAGGHSADDTGYKVHTYDGKKNGIAALDGGELCHTRAAAAFARRQVPSL